MNPLALLALLLLGTIWGTNFVFMKWAGEWLSAEQIVLLRVAFGFLPLLLFALWRGDLKPSHWRYGHHLVVMAILASALYYYAFAVGTLLLPSSVAGMLSGAIPLFATVASFVFLRNEPIRRATVVGVLVGYFGVLLIAQPWQALSGETSIVGVAYVLLGALSVGLSFVYARRFLVQSPLSNVALSTYQTGLSLLILLPLVPLEGMASISQDTRALLGATVGLGLLGTGLAYVLYYFLVQELGAVMAASTTYIPPVVALVIGVAFLDEAIGVRELVAMGLILLGVLGVQIGSLKKHNMLPKIKPQVSV